MTQYFRIGGVESLGFSVVAGTMTFTIFNSLPATLVVAMTTGLLIYAGPQALKRIPIWRRRRSVSRQELA